MKAPLCPVLNVSATVAYKNKCRCQVCMDFHMSYYWRNRDKYREMMNARTARTKAERRQYKKVYYAKNQYKVQKDTAKYFHENRKKIAERIMKNLYGVTVEQYQKMLLEQNGRCAICGSLPKTDKRLFIDHNHLTARVRGLLCPKCNFGIGLFKEDISVMAKAIDYIQKEAQI